MHVDALVDKCVHCNVDCMSKAEFQNVSSVIWDYQSVKKLIVT